MSSASLRIVLGLAGQMYSRSRLTKIFDRHDAEVARAINESLGMQ